MKSTTQRMAFFAYIFLVLAILLLGAGLYFFHVAIGFLSARDYVAAVLVLMMGVTAISIAKEMARYALAKSSAPGPN